MVKGAGEESLTRQKEDFQPRLRLLYLPRWELDQKVTQVAD